MHNATHPHKQSNRSPTWHWAVRHKHYTFSSFLSASHALTATGAPSGNVIIGVCVSPLSLPSPRALEHNLIKHWFKRIMQEETGWSQTGQGKRMQPNWTASVQRNSAFFFLQPHNILFINTIYLNVCIGLVTDNSLFHEERGWIVSSFFHACIWAILGLNYQTFYTYSGHFFSYLL